MRPHRQQPTRLPRPWDSPGKNTGVGCHFLLQCMKVKSESEVAQSRLTQRPHGLKPTRLLHPRDFPGKSTGVGCHHLLRTFILAYIIFTWLSIDTRILVVSLTILSTVLFCTIGHVNRKVWWKKLLSVKSFKVKSSVYWSIERPSCVKSAWGLVVAGYRKRKEWLISRIRG